MRVAIGIMSVIASVLALILAHGCTDPYDGPSEGAGCPVVADTRCAGELSQMCSAEKRWETLYDCAEYGMVCCPDAGECCELDAGEVDANE